MRIFVIFSLVFLLTSCVETIVVGSVAGAGLVVREKSLSDTGKDIAISTKLGTKFIANGLKNPGNCVDITVNEGRVLLTGNVRDESKSVLAQELVWKVDGVKEVINEIHSRSNENQDKNNTKNNTGGRNDFSAVFLDYIITAQVETKLLFARDITSINYQVTTVNGTVYLLGVADNEFEMRRVLSIVSRIRGVDQVVNHVILEDDSRRRHG
ncbi:MAG: hypothetical protein A2887_05675 [Alphaproteobacteria bacterium RIFCSPLOWO2_01_FULL_40_26]|nr:MAG: hypothetical protein A3D15_01935 [Alphaproteobacteria bacterium RIFCSPHIGHO2_02_FULL_40_34]OFW94219.1 MAG: hypothetical protein A2887_05675 [Alphaproteobacteria bacterium RIFCSPLOWO2_01_FULL_40_26]OFX09788.1 MAG: hypothetical protein A3H30_00435 [Alphaproteobacteria bacterium RIFCSPLOWO2_02_FULL_40_19]OFX12271.1 MAG: hypothetical protein A3G22_06995 [Alphaproteobacteria bacterium RIFCSPLOWO2_12_FULL_40_11]